MNLPLFQLCSVEEVPTLRQENIEQERSEVWERERGSDVTDLNPTGKLI